MPHAQPSQWAGEGALVGPHLAPIELGDEGEEAPGGGVDMGGQGGDRCGKCVVVQMCEFIRNRRLEGKHEHTNGKWGMN